MSAIRDIVSSDFLSDGHILPKYLPGKILPLVHILAHNMKGCVKWQSHNFVIII